jgi:hypothetical protein
MSFSGTIKIVDIDDYIKPTQECKFNWLNPITFLGIKPLMQASKSNKAQKIDIETNDIKLNTKVDLVQLYVNIKYTSHLRIKRDRQSPILLKNLLKIQQKSL